MTTIRDVARVAEVSVGTVSRVLNQHPAVNPAIRRAVLTAIDELQYQPNAVARTLRTARTRTLGLVVSDLRNPQAAAAVFWGAETVARQHGYALLLANSQRSPALEVELVRNLLERKVEGLLCAPVDSPQAIHDLAASAQVPAVAFGRSAPSKLLPSAIIDDQQAIAEAVGHLAALGHRRIAFVRDDHRVNKARSADAGRALRACCGDAASLLDCEVGSPATSAAVVGRLLVRHDAPTALLVSVHYLVPCVLLALTAAGLRVPADVSLIAFTDSEWAQVVDPPLSTVRVDLAAHLRSAAGLLIGLIEHREDLVGPIREQADYVRRDSVQAAPTAGAGGS